MPLLQEAPDQSPIGELRSHKLHGLAKKKKGQTDSGLKKTTTNYMLSTRNPL